MVDARVGVRSEEVRRDASLTLFVEGRDENSFDPTVIKEIFKETIRVRPLGPASSVKTVAHALFLSNPDYYFLIDRDFHHDDDFVDKCWRCFLSENTYNLLIWRRKEIENYFLNPEYLKSSKFYNQKISDDKLKDKILELANKRLYLDVANYVLISIREDIKSYKITKFNDTTSFSNDEDALEELSQKLNDATEQYKNHINGNLSSDRIKEKFYKILNKMTGGKNPLEFNSGEWSSMIEGKKILNPIIHEYNFFKVVGKKDTILQGGDKAREIIKGLLRDSTISQPTDFNELKNLFDNKMGL